MQDLIQRRQWQPTPVLLPGKFHGWRSLVGCSPWGHKESDTTERLHFHFSLSYIEEGNGNPFQCSCLENPRDGGAWWAAVYGVAQSRTRLKGLSSSSSRTLFPNQLYHTNYSLLHQQQIIFTLLILHVDISALSIIIEHSHVSTPHRVSEIHLYFCQGTFTKKK